MSLDNKVKENLRRLGAFRDIKVSKIESQASEVERLFFNTHGTGENRGYFREFARLTLEAENLKREPILYNGENFYVCGGEVYSIIRE